MVDFLKAVIIDPDEISRVWSIPKLIFYSHSETLNHFDWESIKTRDKKIYRGILFCRFENKLEVLFSPHYYSNKDVHNANDFTAMQCIKTIEHLLNLFKIDEVEKWSIQNIEVGLNFIMPGYGRDLVTYTEYWKKTPFRFDTELAYSKKAYAVKKSGTANTYKIIKLYCKYSQFPLQCQRDTVRMEIKSKQSRYIERLGVSNIGDLLNLSVYQLMAREILQLSKELLILDHKTTFSNLTIRESRKLKDYLNTHTWYIALQKSANEFYKKKHRYFTLLNKTGSNIHSIIQEIVAHKMEYLSIDPNEKGLNSIASANNQKGLNSCINIDRISPHLDNRQMQCKITGISLEHESSDAKYIRTTTLRYLQKNELKEFNKLKSELLPSKKPHRPKFERSLVAHMSKQIRNRYYNANRIKQKGCNTPRIEYTDHSNLYEPLGMELII